MELKNVKVIQILPIESGTAKDGKEWRKQQIVVEIQGDYPRKMIIALWSTLIGTNPPVGCFADISFDIESREYNGRWYTDVKCWKIVQVGIPVDTGNKKSNKTDTKTDRLPETDFPFPPIESNTSSNIPIEQEEDDGLPF